MSRFNLRFRRVYRFLRRWVVPIAGVISIIRAVLAILEVVSGSWESLGRTYDCRRMHDQLRQKARLVEMQCQRSLHNLSFLCDLPFKAEVQRVLQLCHVTNAG